MSLVTTLLLMAQSASPIVADAPQNRQVAVRASATVRVLRPARISFSGDHVQEEQGNERDIVPQRDRDDAGTLWIEFS